MAYSRESAACFFLQERISQPAIGWYRAALIETIFQWVALAMVAGGCVALVTIIDVALIATFHRRH